MDIIKTGTVNVNQGALYNGGGYVAKSSSVGRWAQRGGALGLIDAGHTTMGTTGVYVYQPGGVTTANFIGQVTYNAFRHNSYADAAFITRGSGVTPNTSPSALPIRGEVIGNVSKGTTVMRRGKSSTSSGVVLRNDITLEDKDTHWFTKSTTEASYTTIMGESGNCIVTGNNLVCGIQSAGTGPSYYSQWGKVKSELEVTLYLTP